MSYKRLLTTINVLNRKTSLIQYIFICGGIVLLIINRTLSSQILEFLWKYFPTSDSKIFSYIYIFTIIIIPFFVIKTFFLLIGIIKYFFEIR